MRSFSHTQRVFSVCYLWKHKQIGCSVAFSDDDVGLGCICWMNKAPNQQQKPWNDEGGFWAQCKQSTLFHPFSAASLLLLALDDFRCDLEPEECERMNCFRNGTEHIWHSPSGWTKEQQTKYFLILRVYKIFWSTWMETTMLRRFNSSHFNCCVYAALFLRVRFRNNDDGGMRRQLHVLETTSMMMMVFSAFLSFVLCSVLDYEFNNGVHTIDGSSARAKGSSLIIISLFVGKWCEHVNHYRKNCWSSLDCTRPFVCVGNNTTKHRKKNSSKQHHIGIYSLCMLMMMIYGQNASCCSSQQSDSGEEWKRSIKISSESFGACVCDPSDETDNEYAQFLIRISFGISIMLHRDARRRRSEKRVKKS